MKNYFIKFNKFNNYYAIGFLALILFVFLSINSASASEITASNVIQLVNKERLSQGLGALTENSILDQAATDKLNDMIKDDYFAHFSPGGISPWHWFEKNNYDYKYAGENLAINFKTAENEHAAWMASPSHRKNILNPNYQEIGVAVGVGKINSETSTLVVQLFGTQVAGVSTYKNPEPTGAEEEAKISQPTADENVIIIPEIVKTPELKPDSVDIKNPVCAGGNCRFGNSQTSLAQAKNVNEGIAWAFVVLILALSVGINTYTLNRHHKHNPFIAANTVVLLMMLTSIVMWRI